MLRGPDLNSWKAGFDFAAAARQEVVDFAYIKLGGNNIANAAGIRSPYVSGSYADLVDRSRIYGVRVGHYWLTGGTDPAGSARFFVANLRNFDPRRDFLLLDNETLDDGRTWTDSECAVFWDTVAAELGAPLLRFQYSSKNLFAPLPLTLARGIKLVSADYNGIEDIASAIPDVVPTDSVVGHQFTDAYAIGGMSVDYNVFADHAFDLPSSPAPVQLPTDKAHPMYFIQHAISGAIAVVFPWMNNGKGAYRHVNAPEWQAAQAAGYKYAPLSHTDWEEIMAEMVPTSGIVGQ